MLSVPNFSLVYFYDKGVKLTRLTANALLSINLKSRSGLTLQEEKIKLSEKTWTGTTSHERDCRVQRSLDTGTRVRGKLCPPLSADMDADKNTDFFVTANMALYYFKK